MDDIEHLATVQLGAGDAVGGLKLSTEAHWNQTEDDWRFFLTRGTVFGVRDRKGNLVASAALLPYSERDAWISMVLVTENFQRRGLATRLVDACLDAARKRGLTTWLDATPAGAQVYGPLGFTPTLQLRRLRLANATASGAKAISAGKFNEFLTCDMAAMGFGRRDLLQELSGRSASRLLSTANAMALVRDGRAARHVGPVFATTPAEAIAMVHGIASSENGPLLIDAIATQDAFIKGLTDDGWAHERQFQRMRFGRATSESSEAPFAVAGPEFG